MDEKTIIEILEGSGEDFTIEPLSPEDIEKIFEQE